MDSVIVTKNVSKVYGTKNSVFKALDNINLSIGAGESLAITGKSGSGKSTLMHLLALLDEPTQGSIIINNQDSHKLTVKNRDLLRNQNFGFVFQQFFLNAQETVIDNVILPLKIAGISASKRRKMAIEVLKSVDLKDKIKSKVINLSGGQKQRVCIARALINNPKIIFADEPTGNLDSNTGQIIEDLLFKLNREKNITLIIVTHDDDLAKKCDRTVRMKDGQLIKEVKNK